jgi:hypothetical protein
MNNRNMNVLVPCCHACVCTGCACAASALPGGGCAPTFSQTVCAARTVCIQSWQQNRMQTGIRFLTTLLCTNGPAAFGQEPARYQRWYPRAVRASCRSGAAAQQQQQARQPRRPRAAPAGATTGTGRASARAGQTGSGSVLAQAPVGMHLVLPAQQAPPERRRKGESCAKEACKSTVPGRPVESHYWQGGRGAAHARHMGSRAPDIPVGAWPLLMRRCVPCRCQRQRLV